MKRLAWLLAVIFFVQCEKQSTEPEIKYYDVEYLVWSAGDTTQIMYLDENEEYQLIEFAHNKRRETWQLKFKAKEGITLSIIAQSYGESYNQYLPVVSVWCYIYVDGATVASNTADACLNESCDGCTYWSSIDYYDCMAYAFYKIQ